MCSWHELSTLSHPGGGSGPRLGSEQEPTSSCAREAPCLTGYLHMDAVSSPVHPVSLFLLFWQTWALLSFSLSHLWWALGSFWGIMGKTRSRKLPRDRKTTSYPVLFLLLKFCLVVVSVNSFFLCVPYDPQLFSKSPKAIDRLCGFDLGQRCSF